MRIAFAGNPNSGKTTMYNALGHCTGKLVRVIWKMLTDEVEFNLE